MAQPIIFGEERYSIWKRLSIFLIDGLTSLITFVILFFTLGTLSVKSICYDDIQKMNTITTEIYQRENLDYKEEGIFGLLEIDYDKFIDKEVANNPDIEKANEKYSEVSSKVEKELNENNLYREAYGRFYATYISTVVTSMLVPLFVFQLLIPLLNKKHQTTTMMMFKVSLVDAKTNKLISGVKLLLRFLIIFTTEFLCIYLILNWLGIMFVVLSTFALISFTNNRSTFHDLILKTKIAKWYVEE